MSLRKPGVEVLPWKLAIETGIFSAKQRKILRWLKEQNWRCGLCGKVVQHPIKCFQNMTDENMPTFDHKVPRSKGGTNNRGNLHVVHRRCNIQRGAGVLPVQSDKRSDDAV